MSVQPFLTWDEKFQHQWRARSQHQPISWWSFPPPPSCPQSTPSITKTYLHEIQGASIKLGQSKILHKELTLNSRSPKQAQEQQGPSMIRTFCPYLSFTFKQDAIEIWTENSIQCNTSNLDLVHCHTFTTWPIASCASAAASRVFQLPAGTLTCRKVLQKHDELFKANKATFQLL